MSQTIPAAIAAKVDAIMSASRARFGHGAYFMELGLPSLRQLVNMAGDSRALSGMQSDELKAMLAHVDQTLIDEFCEDGRVRDLNDDEGRDFDALVDLRESAYRRQAAAGMAAKAFTRGNYKAGANFGPAAHRDAEMPGAGEVRTMTAAQVRDDALRALEARGKHLDAAQGDKVDALLRSVISEDNPNTDGSYVARRILLTESDAYRSAWQRVVTRPNPILTAEEADAMRAFEEFERTETRAMSEGTQSAGGYGVPAFIDPSIIMSAQGSVNPMLQLASRPQVTTNVWKGVSSDGVSWSFDPEGGTVSDDSPTLAQPSIPVYMARGFVPFSIEVGEDYPSFATEMARLLGEGYDELLANKLTVGSGTAEPLGLVTALDADTTVEVLLTTAGAIATGDITKVWAALPDRFKARSNWMMSYAMADKVTALQNYTPNVEALTSLRGRPIAPNSYMTDLTGTSHTNAIVVGDFANYVAPQRTGMSVELIPHLFDVTNNRPTGQRGWFAYARVGGAPSTNKGFRLLNQT